MTPHLSFNQTVWLGSFLSKIEVQWKAVAPVPRGCLKYRIRPCTERSNSWGMNEVRDHLADRLIDLIPMGISKYFKRPNRFPRASWPGKQNPGWRLATCSPLFCAAPASSSPSPSKSTATGDAAEKLLCPTCWGIT